MLINFESFLVLLGFVWAVGEVLIQTLKNKLKIDNMIYAVIVFGLLGVFTIIYDIVVNCSVVNPTYIMNCIVYLVFCIIIPLSGYDTIIELIKRIGKK